MSAQVSKGLHSGNISRVAILLIGLIVALLCGLLIARTPTSVAIIIVALLILPVVAAVRDAPIMLYLASFPVVWQWSVVGTSADRAIGVFCLVAWCIGVLLRRQTFRLPSTTVGALILSFFAISLLSIVLMSSNNPEYLMRIYALNGALFLLAIASTSSLTSIIHSLYAIVAGTTAAGLIALVSFLQGTGIQSQGLSRLGVESVGVNHFAAVLLLGSAIAIGLAVGESRGRQLAIFWIVGIALTLLVILSQSRGAFTGQVVLMIVGIAFVGRGRRRILMLLPTIMIAGLVLVGAGRSGVLGDYSSRITDLISGGEALETARPHLWSMAGQAFLDHPLFGLGVGNFTVPANWFDLAAQTMAPGWIFPLADVHSFYLGTLAEVGVIGSAPLICAMVLIGIGISGITWRSSILNNPTLARSSYAILFGCAAYFTAIALLPARTIALPYVLLGIAEGFRQTVMARPLPEANETEEA